MHTCTLKQPVNGSLDYTRCLCQAVCLLTHQHVAIVLCKLTSLLLAHMPVRYEPLSGYPWLLVKLTPKGVVFSFPFSFFPVRLCCLQCRGRAWPALASFSRDRPIVQGHPDGCISLASFDHSFLPFCCESVSICEWKASGAIQATLHVSTHFAQQWCKISFSTYSSPPDCLLSA